MKNGVIKKLFILTLFVITLTQTACSYSSHSPKQSGNDQGQQETQMNKKGEEVSKWQQLGPDMAEVSQIQVTSDDSVYLLSQGKLYLLKNDEFIHIGPQVEVTNFYVLEQKDKELVYAADNEGSLYVRNNKGSWYNTVSPVIKGQPISAMAGDASRGILYVGQSSKNGGGLWKSEDEGRSWKKLTDTTVRSVVIHPQERDFLYIIDKAAYLSSNGGKNWEKIDTPANYGLLIHPLDNQTIYLAYSKGVVTAELDGIIKNNASFELPGVMTCLEMNFIRYGEWAVSMWDYPSGTGGLYLSFDKGSVWTKIDEKLDKVRILDMRFGQNGDKLYIGTAGQGLWTLNLQKIR